MEVDSLTKVLYQENLKWVYSIIKELDYKNIEKKEKFINNAYTFNNFIVLGYYFMNLYVVANLNEFNNLDTKTLMNSILMGASNYNKEKLDKLFKTEVDLNILIDQYNTLVRKTKIYAPNDGLKARIVSIDEIYRRIYDVVNKQHFNDFTKIFLVSFSEYEKRIEHAIKNNT